MQRNAPKPQKATEWEKPGCMWQYIHIHMRKVVVLRILVVNGNPFIT